MKRLKYYLITVAVILTLYSASVKYNFVRYDDYEYVFENERMRHGLTVDNVIWAFSSCGYASNWHPITWISLMCDVTVDRIFRQKEYQSFDEWNNLTNPVAHIMHLHNVLLHAAISLLLLILIETVLRQSEVCDRELNIIWPALTVLLWAAHPLRVEVVCWVSERKELLSALFMLLTLLAHIKIRGELLCYLLFALSLMAKPVAVTLPAVILSWDMLFLHKIQWRRIIMMTIMAIGAIALTMCSQQEAIAFGTQLNVTSRIMSIIGSPIIYICETFWPIYLSPLYALSKSLNCFVVIGGIAIVISCIALCIFWLIKPNRWTAIGAFAVSWIYVGLIPMLGVVKVGIQEHSDRYTYWIGCGTCVCVGLLLGAIRPHVHKLVIKINADTGRDEWPSVRKLAIYIAAATIIAFSFLTIKQMDHWKDTVNLFRHALPCSWNADAANILAKELEQRNEWQEAENWLRQCASHDRNAHSYLNLANFILRKHKAKNKLLNQDYAWLEEVEILVDSVLSADPTNKEAADLKAILEMTSAKFPSIKFE